MVNNQLLLIKTRAKQKNNMKISHNTSIDTLLHDFGILCDIQRQHEKNKTLNPSQGKIHSFMLSLNNIGEPRPTQSEIDF